MGLFQVTSHQFSAGGFKASVRRDVARKSLLGVLSILSGLLVGLVAAPIAEANVLQSACVIGSSTAGCAAYSPQEIYNLYGTETDGTQYISIGGSSTQVYLLMNRSNSDSGGWVLLMKGIRGSTNFGYSSTMFTSSSSTMATDSLSDDVSTDAKFSAFNNLSVKKLLAVFKSPQNGSISAGGDISSNAFGGHVWLETLSSTATAYNTLATTNNLASSFAGLRYSLYRQSNSVSATQVFSYQTGYASYGFNQTACGAARYARWGIVFNNEGDGSSCDTYVGIGLASSSPGDQVMWSGVEYPSQGAGSGKGNMGFQIWGKMSDPSLLSPRSLSVTDQGSGSVNVSWLPPSSGTTTEYVLQYKTSAQLWNQSTSHRVTSPTSTPSVALTGLSAGQYDFRVFARNSGSSQSSATPVTSSGVSIDTTAPVTSVSISANYLNSGASVSTVLSTNETLSSVTLYYSTSSSLTSPQSCGTTSNPINGQSLTCTIASSDATYYIYSRGTDSAGNVEAAPVTADDSIIRDTVAPTRSTATLLSAGNQIQLAYNETLSTTAPAAARFSVSDSGTARSITGVSFADSRTITLTLSATIATARSVTISYDTATSGALSSAALIEDLALNDAASFTNVSLTNNSTVLNTLATPTTLAVSGNETNTATFTYTPTTNASSHTLRLYDSATSTLLSTTTSFTSGSTRTGLSPATQYYATLQAVGDGITYESSTASSPLYFTTAIRKPVISSQPTDTATTTSRSAIFTVSATSPDAGTLSYQWQVSTNSGVSFSNLSNGSGISGVTTTTLTLTSLTTSEDTYRYRVVVTNTKSGVTNSETSTAATLTVNVAISFSAPAAISTTYGVAASSSSLTATGGTGNKTFSLSPSATGISINATTGIVSVSSSAARRSTTSFTITATDEAGATATQSISITVATGTSSITLTVPGTPRKGGTFTLSAVTSSTGTVAFRAKGRIISGCAARNVNAGTLTATCTWKPISHGPQAITASYTSNDSDWGNASSSREVIVLRRVSR